MQTATALARLRACGVSPEPPLFTYAISIIISSAGSYCLIRFPGSIVEDLRGKPLAIPKQGLNLCHLMTEPTKWSVCDQQRLRSARASAQSDQSLAVHMKKPWVLSYALSAQRRFWSVWVDAQADLSLHLAHMPFCWFCHAGAHFSNEVRLAFFNPSGYSIGTLSD